MVDFFLFHFLYNGYSTCKSIETDQIEGAVTLIIEHYEAHFDLQQKIDHLLFHEICTV